jgi:hypothetical protein
MRVFWFDSPAGTEHHPLDDVKQNRTCNSALSFREFSGKLQPMPTGQNEAFSRVLIDKALEFRRWNLLDPHEVRFEFNGETGRADYVLMAQHGSALCVAEDSTASRRFMSGDITVFTANQFRTLGGLNALARFDHRDDIFEALRQSALARQSLVAA